MNLIPVHQELNQAQVLLTLIVHQEVHRLLVAQEQERVMLLVAQILTQVEHLIQDPLMALLQQLKDHIPHKILQSLIKEHQEHLILVQVEALHLLEIKVMDLHGKMQDQMDGTQLRELHLILVLMEMTNHPESNIHMKAEILALVGKNTRIQDACGTVTQDVLACVMMGVLESVQEGVTLLVGTDVLLVITLALEVVENIVAERVKVHVMKHVLTLVTAVAWMSV